MWRMGLSEIRVRYVRILSLSSHIDYWNIGMEFQYYD